MELNKIFHKARKAVTPKSHTQKMLEIRARILNLNSTLDATIWDNVMQLRKAQHEGKSNKRAENRVKNAYYTRMVMENALEDLKEAENDAELAKVVNKAGRTIFRLNSMTEFAPKIGESFLRWQAEELGDHIAAGATKGAIPTQENDSFSVPEDIVQRLLDGETISSCLESDRDFLNSDYTSAPAMAAEAQNIEGKFDELLKSMKQNV